MGAFQGYSFVCIHNNYFLDYSENNLDLVDIINS